MSTDTRYVVPGVTLAVPEADGLDAADAPDE
jgi:hypothetical protein